MRYRFFVCSAVFIIIAAAIPCYARTRPPLPGEVGVEIVSDNEAGFQAIGYQDWMNGGTRVIKRYLEARKGENYGIVIRNNSPERIGVVIAVDGRNIISGNKSNLGNRERMYIVNAYEHARYEGWRTTDNEVHRFYFTTPSDSYSVKTFADSSAMGVVAVAVYREKELPPQPLIEEQRSGAASSAPSAAAPGTKAKRFADENAGTGFGDAQYSPVVTVAFDPEPIPVQKTLIKYEWRETLCRKGLLRCGQETGNRLWDDNGYAPYPPGYIGPR